MKQRYYNLDMLKAVMAVVIVFHHYQQLSGARFDGINFFGGSFYWGYLVELFFMISGFVLAAGNKKEKTQVYKYVEKCMRIYPGVMLACVTLILIVYAGYFITGEWIDATTDYTSWKTILTSLSLTFNGWFLNVGMGINNPTWYLCVLLLCYILFYATEAISEKVGLNFNLLCFGVFSISFCGKLLGKTFPYFFTGANQRGYVCFFLGVLLHNILKEKFTKFQKMLVIIGLFLLGAFMWSKDSWVVLVICVYPALLCLLVSVKQLPASVSFLGGGGI